MCLSSMGLVQDYSHTRIVGMNIFLLTWQILTMMENKRTSMQVEDTD